MGSHENEIKICAECEQVEEYDDIIGCAEIDCDTWLHNCCDPSIMNRKTAKTILHYYCPPCREKGKEFIMRRGQTYENPTYYDVKEKPKKKYKLRKRAKINHKEQSDDDSNQETESMEEEEDDDEDYSQPLTPYQRLKNNLEEDSENQWTSANDEKTEDLQDKSIEDPKQDHEGQISERLKRLSIKSPEIEKSQEKTRKKMYLKNKKKETILKENLKLNKEIDSLKKKIIEMEEEKEILMTELETEKFFHTELDKLHENMKDKNPESQEKTIFTLTSEKQKKERELTETKKKLEETRKKNVEKQAEIKELKTMNEVNLREISQLKEIGEKETALRAKTEGIALLTEDKIEAQTMKIDELEKTIEKLRIKEKDTEITMKEQKVAIDGLLNAKHEEKQMYAAEIEKLSSEIIMADAEIRIRQKQMEEVIKTQIQQYDELCNSNLEKYLKYKNEVDSKLHKLEQEKKNLECQIKEYKQSNKTNSLTKDLDETLHQNEKSRKSTEQAENSQTIQQLKKELECITKQRDDALKEIEKITNSYKELKETDGNPEQEKDNDSIIYKLYTENEKLKAELEAIGQQKLNNIYKNTKPPNKKQGLPNNSNLCYIIANMHALAHANEKDKNNDEDDIIMKFTSQTKKCIEGRMNAEEAEELVGNIWSYTKEKWPECKRNETHSNQEDAGEFLNQLINESPYLKERFTTNIANTITCDNPDCDIMSNQHRQKQCINLAMIKNSPAEIQLQELIDNITSTDQNVKCDNCGEVAKVKNEIINTPDLLALLVPRVYENGEKVETDVRCPTRTVTVRNKNLSTIYEVQCVIRHRGSQSLNGHYITNIYNKKARMWTQMDDDKVIENNAVKEENKQGLIYIMSKIKTVREKTNNERRPPSPISRSIFSSETNNHANYRVNHHSYESKANTDHKQQYSDETKVHEDYYGIYKSQIPCKYYRNNNCELENDCSYLHQTCAHYQRGYCKFLDKCKFRHYKETPKKDNIYNKD